MILYSINDLRKMKRKSCYLVVVALSFLFNLTTTWSQPQAYYSEAAFVSGIDTLNYRVLWPKDFDTSQNYPLVVFLHGAGERGHDNMAQLTHGGQWFVDARDSFPAIVVFPQCPPSDYWANVTIDREVQPLAISFPKNEPPTTALSLVMELLDDMSAHSYVNTNQIYLGGLSMGGMGTFELLSRKPDVFAAAFSICGAGAPDTVENFAEIVPMWIFHGAKDNVVSPHYSITMVSSLLNAGGTPNFSLYAQDNHNSWDSAFGEPELLSWLFSNSKLNSK